MFVCRLSIKACKFKNLATFMFLLFYIMSTMTQRNEELLKTLYTDNVNYLFKSETNNI